jgi:hypothetical protein
MIRLNFRTEDFMETALARLSAQVLQFRSLAGKTFAFPEEIRTEVVKLSFVLTPTEVHKATGIAQSAIFGWQKLYGSRVRKSLQDGLQMEKKNEPTTIAPDVSFTKVVVGEPVAQVHTKLETLCVARIGHLTLEFSDADFLAKFVRSTAALGGV